MQFEEFYNEFSDFYDSMTNFENRFQKEEPFFEEIIKKYGVSCSLDIGCGTGFHSFLLAKLGMKVTGIDPSQGMIRKANERLEKSGLDIEFYPGFLEEFTGNRQSKFDSAFCLGNTLPHIQNKQDLILFFQKVKFLLTKNGVFIIQIVNYDKVLNNKQRILNINEKNEKMFVRFYDFYDNKIVFNILTIIRTAAGFENKIISTDLYPYRFPELEEAAGISGFKIDAAYGNIRFGEYSPDNSENIILFLVNQEHVK